MDRHRRSSRARPGSGAGLRLLVLLAAIGASACVSGTGLSGPSGGPASAGAAGPSASPAAATASPVPTDPGPTASAPSPTPGPVTAVLVGAGDIADCESRPASASAAAATARLIEGIAGTVFTAGDNAYEGGSDEDFRQCYDPTWGVFKDRTLLPATGNHEYKTPGAAGHYAYFGKRAGAPGEGWYSSEIGGWHVVVLNSNCTVVGCGEGSPQLAWLRADLAAHPAACTLAIWHHPRFSSGLHGADTAVSPFWGALLAANAELIVNGHDHDYERFAPQDPSGRLDLAGGIREIVVGTGGAALRPFPTLAPNQEAADARTHGVLVLTLHSAGYEWRFAPVAGKTFGDSGSATCH